MSRKGMRALTAYEERCLKVVNRLFRDGNIGNTAVMLTDTIRYKTLWENLYTSEFNTNIGRKMEQMINSEIESNKIKAVNTTNPNQLL